MTQQPFRKQHPVWFGLAIAAGAFMTLCTVVVVWFFWALSNWSF